MTNSITLLNDGLVSFLAQNANQALVLAMGTLIVALSALVKSKADKATNLGKVAWYIFYIVVLIVGCTCTYFGNQISKEEKKQIKKETEAKRLEEREEFHRIRARLYDAEHKNAEDINNAKLQVLKPDIEEWADSVALDFTNDYTHLDKELAEKAVQEQVVNELRLTEETYNVLAFAVSYIRDSIKAASDRNNLNVDIDMSPLPTNFYERAGESVEDRVTRKDEVSTERFIVFTNGSRWRVAIGASRPARDERPPYMWVDFLSSKNPNSGMGLFVYPHLEKIAIQYRVTIPGHEKDNTDEYPYANYETTIRTNLERILKVQLTLAHRKMALAEQYK